MSDQVNPLTYPSLPSKTPDAPKPARFKPIWPLVTGLISTAAVAGGSFLGLVGVQRTATLGSTRSARLKWEQRDAETRDVIAQQKQQHQQDSAHDDAG